MWARISTGLSNLVAVTQRNTFSITMDTHTPIESPALPPHHRHK